MLEKLRLPFLKWVKGPIAIAGGWLGTWLYTNVPGLHVFGATNVGLGKWISGALAFAVSAAAMWLAHDHAVNAFIEHTLGKEVNPLAVLETSPKKVGVVVNNPTSTPLVSTLGTKTDAPTGTTP